MRKVDLVDRHANAAIAEARKSLHQGGIPIGAVLVRGGEIIGRGFNRRVQNNDPTAHGEIECLRNAGRFDGKGVTLYTTLSPCPMCAGATLIAKIRRIVIIDRTNYAGYTELLERMGVDIVVMEDSNWIQEFSIWCKANEKLWNEDGDWEG